MSTKAMNELRENLCTELDPYSKKPTLSKAELEEVHLMTDTIKNIDKISMMEEQGNSYGNGMWNASGTYGNGSYGNGSYGNGMNSSGRRGSRGGYPNDGYSGNGYMGSGYANDRYDYENQMRREMNY